MPIYCNELSQAVKAIDNIMNQDYENIEIIVVNDNSSEEVSHYLNKIYADNFIVINNVTNLGIANSTNIGIGAANGELIAIFHDDDEYFHNRISTMVNEYKSIKFDLSGSNFITKSDNKTHRLPTENNLIRISLFFKCPFLNPSVVFRNKSIKEFKIEYPDNAPVEDYLLWIKLSQNHKISFKNVSQTLLKYNDRETRMTSSSGGKILLRREKLIKAITSLFEINGIDYFNEEVNNYVDFFNGFRKLSNRELNGVKYTLLKISDKFRETKDFNKYKDISRYYFSKGVIMQLNFKVLPIGVIHSYYLIQFIILKFKMRVHNEVW
jgi:glycosyltransferase involved in cell wall biosynthesis